MLWYTLDSNAHPIYCNNKNGTVFKKNMMATFYLHIRVYQDMYNVNLHPSLKWSEKGNRQIIFFCFWGSMIKGKLNPTGINVEEVKTDTGVNFLSGVSSLGFQVISNTTPLWNSSFKSRKFICFELNLNYVNSILFPLSASH